MSSSGNATETPEHTHNMFVWEYEKCQNSLSKPTLRGLDTLGSWSSIFSKGDNFCDFLFAFLNSKPLLKRVLLLKESICSQGEQMLSF